MSILNHVSAHIPDEAVYAALLSMAKDNVGTDVQELLMHGFDKLRVKPNALRNALTAAHPHLSAPCAVEVVDRAKRIANIYRNKDDATVIASFHKETARVIDELLSCVVTNPVDVAAVREALSETRIDLVILRGNIADAEKTDGRWDGMPDRVQSWIDRIDTALALSPTEPVQGEQWQPIETAPKDGIEFIARCGADKPSFSCFWDGTAFMHFDHGEGLISYSPTEWMPLPTSPNTEVGKCN